MTTVPRYLSMPPQGAVVVGVSLDGADAAITFAAEEARLTHRPLHLLHALRVSAADAYAGVYSNAVQTADEVLESAVRTARALAAGEVPVTAERVDDAWLTRAFSDHVRDCGLVVLQHRGLSRWQRVVAGSTVSGVAARCPIPVVSVPEAWTPDPDAERVVSVGVQDGDEARPLVRHALQLAQERDARVVVVHAWWLYGGYDSLVADERFRAERERDALERIQPGIEAARRDFPDVPLTIDIQHATPVTALRDATADSLLVVIGRRHHRLPLGSHLGPVSRAVLRDATGPVLVHPELPVAQRAEAEDTAPSAVAAMAP